GVGSLWRCDRDFGTPPSSLRGQYRLQGPARAARLALLGAVARRRAAGNRRIRRPSLVHRRAIPPRTEIATVRSASVVCVVHSGRGGAEPVGVTAVKGSLTEFARGLIVKPSLTGGSRHGSEVGHIRQEKNVSAIAVLLVLRQGFRERQGA